MKRLLFFFTIIFINSAYSQETKLKANINDIEFKAKLFTVSEYGIANKATIISNIDSQKISKLQSAYENFIFFKIEFSQPYIMNDGSIHSLIRYCDYIVAYNMIDCIYYKLGGFDSIDIDRFFKDLQLHESSILKGFDDKEIEGISIQCLYSYYKMNEKQQIKKGYKCFEQCSNVTSTFYKDFNKDK